MSPLLAALAEICFYCLSKVRALSYSSLKLLVVLYRSSISFLCHLACNACQ